MSDSSQQSAATAALSRAPHKSSGSLGPVAQTPAHGRSTTSARLLRGLLALGAQTARVDRNAVRIAGAFGFAVDLAVFPKHLMLSVTSADGRDRRTSVGSIKPVRRTSRRWRASTLWAGALWTSV